MTAIVGFLTPLVRQYWSYAALLAVSALAWHFDNRAIANAAAMRAQAAQFKQAQADAAADARAALQREQTAYQTKAMEADRVYQTQLVDARSAADRYIAAHRVQPSALARGTRATFATAQSDRAGVSANLPDTSVVVSPRDVQACTDAVTYAVKAHDWAIALAP